MDIILITFLGQTVGCYALLSLSEYLKDDVMPRLKRGRTSVHELYPVDRKSA